MGVLTFLAVGGRFETRICYSRKVTMTDPITGLISSVMRTTIQGPVLEFTDYVTEDGIVLPYKKAVVDTDTLDFQESYLNLDENRPTNSRDLLKCLKHSCSPFLDTTWGKLRIQATPESVEDIKWALANKHIETRWLNDDFGILSPQNRNSLLLDGPKIKQQLSSIVIDDLNIDSLDSLEKSINDSTNELIASISEKKTKR